MLKWITCNKCWLTRSNRFPCIRAYIYIHIHTHRHISVKCTRFSVSTDIRHSTHSRFGNIKLLNSNVLTFCLFFSTVVWTFYWCSLPLRCQHENYSVCSACLHVGFDLAEGRFDAPFALPKKPKCVDVCRTFVNCYLNACCSIVVIIIISHHLILFIFFSSLFHLYLLMNNTASGAYRISSNIEFCGGDYECPYKFRFTLSIRCYRVRWYRRGHTRHGTTIDSDGWKCNMMWMFLLFLLINWWGREPRCDKSPHTILLYVLILLHCGRHDIELIKSVCQNSCIQVCSLILHFGVC